MCFNYFFTTAESWSDWFTKVGGAVAKGLEVVDVLVNQIEVAFDANNRRGVGILWLPKSRQALYYYIDWKSFGLNFHGTTDIEKHLANIIFGLSMWQGLIICHRSLMLRDPTVKVKLPQFLNEEKRQENNTRSDESVLWSIVDRLKENLFMEWSYISPTKLREDERYQKVVQLLNQGQLFGADSSAFNLFSISKSNPRDTLQYILPILPKSYIQDTTHTLR